MYKRYRRYRRYTPSLLEIVVVLIIERLLFPFIIFVFESLIKIGYVLYDRVIQAVHNNHVFKKGATNIQEEITPLPEISFKEDEEEKEVYLPYRKKTFLLSRAEYAFDKVLSDVVGDRFYIGRQVPLSSIVEVTTTYKPYRSKIDKKTIDFVLFNKAGYTPYLAIELDDRSHLRLDRIKRDQFVESVLSKAGIRLARVENSYEYDKNKLLNTIDGD